MRPIKLTMSAFGPYAVEQTIDFNLLGNKNIFLIHGPTGAGKTTILDGICYALYGDTSGDERNGKNMRSHHSGLDQLTEVVFDFGLRGNSYRVIRRPEQERLKKSGQGTTVQTAEAELYKLDQDDNTKLIQSGWKGVTDEVEKIIGFRSGQFRQVIMLPQGQFRKLLMADSKEREEILEKLFRTEVYKRIEQLLHSSSKELRDSIKEVKKEQEIILNRSGSQSIDDLERLIEENQKQYQNSKDELKIINEVVKISQQELNKAREDNIKIKELEDARLELKRLGDLRESFDLKRQELELSRKALTLMEAEKSARLMSQYKKDWEDKLKEGTEDLEKTQETYKNSEENLNREKDREEDRKNAQGYILQLNQYTDIVSSLEGLRQEITALKLQLDKENTIKEQQKSKVTNLEGTIEKQRTLVGELKLLEASIPLLKTKYEEAEKVLKKGKTYHSSIDELNRINTQYLCKQDNYNQLQADFQNQRQQYNILEQKWSKGQAAILASQLEEQSPCPVCGSTHHPKKAELEEGLPTQQQLEDFKKLIQAMEEEKNKTKAELDQINIKKSTLQESIGSLEVELGNHKDKEIKALTTALEEALSNLKQTEDRVKERERLAEDLNKTLESLDQAKLKFEEAEAKLKAIEGDYQSKVGAFREKERSVPENIRNPEALLKEQKIAQQSFNRLKEDYERAEKQYQQAVVSLTKAKSSKAQAEEELSKAVENLNKEKDMFRQRLIEAGFKGYPEYECAKKDEKQITDLEYQIKAFDGKLHSSQDNCLRLEKLVEGLVGVDLTEIETKLRKVEEQRDGMLKLISTLEERIKNDASSLKEISRLGREIEEKEKQYQVIGHLSEVSNGNNAFGITFQRFVLGALLDDITIAATHRLKLMSKGRYQLKRTLDRARKNAAGGLELEVFDTYTGLERPVSTLSGGESFLASLSLALGLADVVQSYSGGISLDTIFVDEGFGTLDPESLDFAIKTLIDLQEGGRLVGIISHVPELKERIDARLEVRPTEKGSVAAFRVG